MIEVTVRIRASPNLENTRLAMEVLALLKKRGRGIEVDGEMRGVPLVGRMPIRVRRAP